MKKIFRLSALFCAMTLLVTSCTQEVLDEPQVKPAVDGSDIQFGARAGFENANPESRTVYSGETYEVEIETSDGTKKITFERIDWVDYTVNAETGEITGDVIDIYSPEASNGPVSSYWVNDNSQTGNNTDEGYLIKTQDSSLQWNGNGPHTFYGVYPSNAMFGAMTTPIENTFADGVLTATISKEQHTQGVTIGTTTDGHTLYEMKPDMRFAYMVAKTTVDAPTNSVSLSFVPCVTAIRVVLKHPVKEASDTQVQHAMYLAAVELQGKGILGSFTADLKNWDKDKSTYPNCENSGDAETVQSINMLIRDNNDQPILMQPGDELAFTVFVRPGANINASDLTVKFSSDAFQYKSKSLAQSTAEIPAFKKSSLKGLKLPMILGDFEFGEYSNWMSQLKPEAKLNRLSLPGTGGTFSYAYDGDDPKFYQQQTLTFDQQWAAGIRAFEIVCDRPSSASTTLANQDVDCNKESVSTKVGTVLTDLLKKTATITDSDGNLSECAVLILTYQPHGASPDRNASSFASSLYEMWYDLTADQKAQIVQYTPDMTIGDAAGKVMIFARVNQNDEKDGGDTDDKTAFEIATDAIEGTNITLIDGCGTGKDRWGARGYKINGERAADISNEASDYLENYMKTNDYVLGAGATKGEADFSFNTNFEDTKVWYQEWARVIPQDTYKAAGRWYIIYSYPAIYWFESYNEKLQNAKDTFLKAINSQSTDKTIYINSLCGYLAGTDFTNSLVPSVGKVYGGDGGNIKALADKLNPDFGGYIREVIAAQQSGPTGIIMMDYISNDPNAGASYYLPSVIISNNIYSGMVDTSGGNTGGGNTDQEKPGGDNGDGDEG